MQAPAVMEKTSRKPTFHALQTKRRVDYKFDPFFESTAVKDRAARLGSVPVSQIPETRIPSPLAENLSPQTVKDLRDYLLGEGQYAVKGGLAGYGSNGREVWESWKRAWDIWNNHYIEGREDPLWIAKAIRDWEAWRLASPDQTRPIRTRKDRPRERTEADAEVEVIADTNITWPEGEKRTKLQAKFIANRDRGPGYVDFSVAELKWDFAIESYPKFATFKNMVAQTLRADAINNAIAAGGVAAGRELERLLNKNRPWGIGHVAFSVAELNWRNTVGAGISPANPPEWLSYQRKYRVVERTQVVMRDVLPSPQTDMTESAAKSLIVQLYNSPRQSALLEGYLKTNSSQGSGYVNFSVALTKWTVERMQHQGQLPRPEWKSFDLNVINAATVSEPFKETISVRVEEADEEFEDGTANAAAVPQPLSVDRSGSSGGFHALKNLDAWYQQPGWQQQPGEEDPPFDLVENTVWRPRRVGEKKLKIDLDQDIEDFLKTTELEVDGGVDCGRAPYPLLRPLTQYRNAVLDSCAAPYWKEKKWDGVTGTIFNMPIRALEGVEYDQPIDELTKKLYGDRDNERTYNKSIFPLDIRRIEALDRSLYTDWPTNEIPAHELLAPQTRVIELSNENPKEYRHMDPKDPWFVTDAQRELRDNPPRTYPLNLGDTRTFLPTDQRLWETDVRHDSEYRYRYFAANLDGRTLIINGVKVARGEIAGPLPPFAVIQTHGGQISFWWGTDGRRYAGQPAHIDFSGGWEQLRSLPGWKNVAAQPGAVWGQKILEYLKDNDDDEEDPEDQWVIWKKATPIVTPPTPPNTPPRDDRSIPEFATKNEELKWVYLKCREQNDDLIAADMVDATEETAWGGLPDVYWMNQKVIRNGLTRTELQDEETAWLGDQHAVDVQTAANETRLAAIVGRAKTDLDAAQAAQARKRKREENAVDPPNSKRLRDIKDDVAQALQDAKVIQDQRDKDEIDKLIAQRLKEEAEKAQRMAFPALNDKWKKQALDKFNANEAARLQENDKRRREGNVRPQIPPPTTNVPPPKSDHNSYISRLAEDKARERELANSNRDHAARLEAAKDASAKVIRPVSRLSKKPRQARDAETLGKANETRAHGRKTQTQEILGAQEDARRAAAAQAERRKKEAEERQQQARANERKVAQMNSATADSQALYEQQQRVLQEQQRKQREQQDALLKKQAAEAQAELQKKAAEDKALREQQQLASAAALKRQQEVAKRALRVKLIADAKQNAATQGISVDDYMFNNGNGAKSEREYVRYWEAQGGATPDPTVKVGDKNYQWRLQETARMERAGSRYTGPANGWIQRLDQLPARATAQRNVIGVVACEL